MYSLICHSGLARWKAFLSEYETKNRKNEVKADIINQQKISKKIVDGLLFLHLYLVVTTTCDEVGEQASHPLYEMLMKMIDVIHGIQLVDI